MKPTVRFLGVATIGLVIACGDFAAPTLDDGPLLKRQRPRIADLFGSNGRTDDALAAATCTYDPEADVPPCALRHAPDAPALESYHPSFQIATGLQHHLPVYYLDPVTGVREIFAIVTIPRDAEFFDAVGNRVPNGQSLVITMDIDSVYFQVDFAPHGAQFGGNKPATLRFSLLQAAFDGADPASLSVYYRPEPTDTAWTELPTTFSQRAWWVEGPVYHFSGYAVAW